MVSFNVSTDIDANLTSSQVPARVFSVSNGAGYINLHTNGAIVSVETIDDLLVGVIESTTSDVTLSTATAGASISAGNDGLGVDLPRVIGTVVTLTAGGTIGRAAPAFEYLNIRSSNFGAGKLIARAPGGVFIRQTDGDLVLGEVVTAGDVALLVSQGSLRNDPNDTAGRVVIVGHNIDLVVVGDIGAADSDIVLDTAVDGHLAVSSTGNVYITEATGPLTVLQVVSVDGGVRLTVPYVAGGVDADLTLLPNGIRVDGITYIGVGGVLALAGDVELRIGNDLWAPSGTVLQGDTLTIRLGFGQSLTSFVGTTAYFGGTVTAANGETRVFGNYGDDTVFFDEAVLSGQTTVFGGASETLAGADGDDLVVITRITMVPGTHIGTANDPFNGRDVPNSLRVDGQNGSNHVEVTLWGAGDPLERETRIVVVGTGNDPFGINTLTVNTSDGDDVIVLRALNYIAGVPEARRGAVVAVATGPGTFERVSYDRSVNGKLTVNALDGDDTIVLDDNSAPTTINGGKGDDIFIVGQFFESERIAPRLPEEDAFATVLTEHGWLSPGISYPAVLYGGAGNDLFVINSNRAELRLEAGVGDDRFVFFATTLPAVGPTPGVGAAVQNGFVSIDGGTGTSTVTVQTMDASAIVFDVLWKTIVGGGLQIDLYNVGTVPGNIAPQPLPVPFGLSGEDGIVMSRMALIDPALPPYAFGGRGAGDDIVIVETDDWTNVDPIDQRQDSYTIRLVTPSTAPVYITITSAYGGGSQFAEFSIDGGLTWHARIVMMIAAGDTDAHTVLVRWAGPASIDDLPAGAGVVSLSHTLFSQDPNYDGVVARNVYVNLFKNPKVAPEVPEEPEIPVDPPVPGDTNVPTGTEGSVLATTGSDAELPIVLALFLLLTGLLLLAGRRRGNRGRAARNDA